MKNYCEFKKDVYVLSNVKDYSETSLPVEVAMNKNDISILEKSILEGYELEEDSFYQKINSSLWSFMHSGVSKFSTNFSGVFLRGINKGSN